MTKSAKHVANEMDSYKCGACGRNEWDVTLRPWTKIWWVECRSCGRMEAL